MKFFTTLSFQASSLICASVLSGALFAQAPKGDGEKRKPPAEAIAACKSLSKGQACTFTSPQRTVTGTCWAPEDKPLACRPKDAQMNANQPPKK